jgi:hypothetical protein
LAFVANDFFFGFGGEELGNFVFDEGAADFGLADGSDGFVIGGGYVAEFLHNQIKQHFAKFL